MQQKALGLAVEIKESRDMAKPLRRLVHLFRNGEGPMARIVQNTAWLLSGKGVGGILSLIYLALATRTLGLEDFGHFTLVLSVAQVVATFIAFQSWQTVLKYGYAVRDDPAALGRLIGRTLGIDMAGAAVGCLLSALLVWFAGPYFGWDRQTQWEALAYSAVILFAVRGTPIGILRMFDRFEASALADTVLPIARLAAAVLAWQLMPTVSGFLIAWASAEVICTLATWYIVHRLVGDRIGPIRPRLMATAEDRHDGLFNFLIATNLTKTLSAASGQLPTLLIGLYVGAAEAGLYRLAFQLSNALSKFAQSIARSVFAEFARSNSHEDKAMRRAELQMLLRKTSRIALISGVAIIAIILLLGKPLLLLMSGEAFLGAYPMLVLLGVATSSILIGVSFEPLLLATDKGRLSVSIRILGVAIMLGLIAYALPHHGAIGAAFAVMIAAIVELLLRGIAAWRVVRSS